MSALKQVLNRRLFRHGGMLGPEDPQGILNSSNALANVVRMQNGGYNDIGAAEMRGATAPIYGPGRPGIYLGEQPMDRAEARSYGLTFDRGAPVLQEDYIPSSGRQIDASIPQDMRLQSQQVYPLVMPAGTPSGVGLAIPSLSYDSPTMSLSRYLDEPYETPFARMFPVEAERGRDVTAGVEISTQPEGMTTRQEELVPMFKGDTRREILEGVPGDLWENIKRLGQRGIAEAQQFTGEDIYSWLDDPSQMTMGQTRVLNTMRRRRPKLKEEVDQITAVYLSNEASQGREVSGEDLGNYVANALKAKYEGTAAERLMSKPETAAERIDAEGMPLLQKPTEEAEGQTIYPGRGLEIVIPPDAGDQEQAVAAGDADADAVYADAVYAGPVDRTTPVDDATTTVTDVVDAPKDGTTPVITTPVITPTVDAPTDGTPPALTPADILSRDSIDALGKHLEKEKVPDQNKEALKFSIEKFKQDFIDAAPEYEGKTDFEKSMTLAKLGMSIAAGRSPHAIQNIANGFLAVADQFTTDDKQKRAYERQVNLSALQYSFGRLKENRVEAREIAKEGRAIHWMSAHKNFKNPMTGEPIEKGSEFVIPLEELRSSLWQRELQNGSFTLTSNYLEKLKVLATEAKATTALVENQYRYVIGQKGAPTQKEYMDQWKDYVEGVEGLGKGATILTLLDVMGSQLQAGEVTGARPYLARKWARFNAIFNWGGKGNITVDGKESALTAGEQKLYRAVENLRDTTGIGFRHTRRSVKDLNSQDINAAIIPGNYLDEKGKAATHKSFEALGIDSIKYFDRAQVVANLMIRELLGEGSKNISNIDRQLAQEIVGLVTDMQAASEPTEVLQARIDRVRQRVLHTFESNVATMQQYEKVYESVYRAVPAEGEGIPFDVVSVLPEFTSRRRKVFEEVRALREGLPEGALGSSQQLKVFDFITRGPDGNLMWIGQG